MTMTYYEHIFLLDDGLSSPVSRRFLLAYHSFEAKSMEFYLKGVCSLARLKASQELPAE
jgi:hypothetical protein